MRVTLILPYPPSANNLFANRQGGGRVKTTKYRQWINHARLYTWAAPVFTEPVTIAITARADDKRVRDGDNLIKPIVDFLKRAAIIPGDDRRWVVKKSIEWGDVDLTQLKVPSTSGVRVEIQTCD